MRVARFDLVVPVAVELVATNFDLSEFLIGHLDARRIGISIQLSMHLESSLGSGGGDEIYDRLETAQGLAAPVLTDIGEEPMFDFVPLAGARWKMAHDHAQARFIVSFRQRCVT